MGRNTNNNNNKILLLGQISFILLNQLKKFSYSHIHKKKVEKMLDNFIYKGTIRVALFY